jgi:hypothetical protein
VAPGRDISSLRDRAAPHKAKARLGPSGFDP